MASRCLKAPLYGARYLTKESITGLLLFGVVSDGSYRGTCPHVSVESRSIEKASGEATSTDKLQVEMLPHMAEGCVRVLIDNSAIQTKGKLPVLPLDVERLPHEAYVLVEVTWQEFLIGADMIPGGCDSYQARYPLVWKG